MRRVKMVYSDLFYKYGDIHAIIDSYRIKSKLGRGTLYKVDNMTDTMREYIMQWKNTALITTVAMYAPEIKHPAFIIYDKCIR